MFFSCIKIIAIIILTCKTCSYYLCYQTPPLTRYRWCMSNSWARGSLPLNAIRDISLLTVWPSFLDSITCLTWPRKNFKTSLSMIVTSKYLSSGTKRGKKTEMQNAKTAWSNWVENRPDVLHDDRQLTLVARVNTSKSTLFAIGFH